jgi:primosomal replication protein N
LNTARNCLQFDGVITELAVLRQTPAGVPVIELKLNHSSQQPEAGITRQVNCELNAVILGPLAAQLASAQLGQAVTVQGFLAAKNHRNQTPVLHINQIEFVEGMHHGFQTENQAQR